MNARPLAQSFICIGLIFAAAMHANAQPRRETPEGVYYTVPERVVIEGAAAIRVETLEIGPLPAEEEPPNLEQLEVWSRSHDGRLIRGTLRDNLARGVTAVPVAVHVANGRFEVQVFVAFTTSRGIKFHKPNADERTDIVFSDVPIPIVIENGDELKVASDRGAQFNVSFLPQQASYPEGEVAAITSSLSAVEIAVEGLLSNNAGLHRVGLRFTNQLANPMASAESDIFTSFQDFAFVKDRLLNFAIIDQEDNLEVTMYEQLPAGNLLDVVFDQAGVIQVQSVAVATSLGGRWGLPVPPQMDMDIRVNPNAVIDFNPVDGIDEGAADFRAMVIHEIIHGLGFLSVADLGVNNAVHLWDIFRLDRDTVGASASLFELRTLDRMLNTQNDAIAVLFTSAAQGLARMSRGADATGDGFGAQHWKESGLLAQENPPATRIGLMDPFGGKNVVPGYLTVADKRAIDQMGWNLNVPGLPQPPAPDQPNQPANQQQDIALNPVLSWTNGTGATRRDVYVYRGNVVDSGEKAFENIDIIGSNAQVTLGALRPGTQYLWFTTSINNVGLAYSEQRTFTTEPPCMGDANFDKQVNFDDLTAITANWLNDYALGTGLGDANFDGFVDFNDTTSVVANWLNICP